MIGGLTAGFLLGTPTIFTQFAFLLQSMNFYSSKYKDMAVAKLPLLEKLESFFTFYIGLIAPERIVLVLLIIGAAMILFLRRWRRQVPYLLVGLLFFVSKPLDLVRAAHHIALWIPFYSLICSLPLAMVTDWAERWNRRVSLPLAFLTVAVLFAVVQNDTYCPLVLKDLMRAHTERAQHILESTEWLRGHTPTNTKIMVAQNCFGPENFYQWYRWMQISVPALTQDGRTYITWWGEQSALKGLSGLVCMSREDTPYLTVWNLSKPGSGTDPLHDQRFRPVRTFGSGVYAIHLLAFGDESRVFDKQETQPEIEAASGTGKPSPPMAVSVSPSTGRGAAQTFAFTFSDQGGADNIVSAQMEVNPVLTQSAACYVYYERASDTIQLAGDSGKFTTMLSPGTSGTQQNRQCTLDGGASSISRSGKSLTIKLALSFKISGEKKIYMEARNNALDSGWVQQGDWIVP
jgi:hypothetical protein